jgi:hypothetical protein
MTSRAIAAGAFEVECAASMTQDVGQDRCEVGRLEQLIKAKGSSALARGCAGSVRPWQTPVT